MSKIRGLQKSLSSPALFLAALCLSALFLLPSCGGGGQSFASSARKNVKSSKGSRINVSIQKDMHQIRPSSLVAPGPRVTDLASVAALEDPYMVSYGYQPPAAEAGLPENSEQLIDPFVAVRGLGGRLWTTRAGELLGASNKKTLGSSLQPNMASLVYHDDAPSSARSLRTNIGITTTILTQAYGQTGKPYKAGAASPDQGFDSTSFVAYVFSQAGYKLPQKGARDIVAAGKPVSKDELRPGDIMVYRDSKGGDSYLLGIYSGNGNFLLASSRFNIITETAAFGIDYGPSFVGGRRYYDDPGATPLPESMKMAVTNGAVKAALAEMGDQPAFVKATQVKSSKPKAKKVVKKKAKKSTSKSKAKSPAKKTSKAKK